VTEIRVLDDLHVFCFCFFVFLKESKMRKLLFVTVLPLTFAAGQALAYPITAATYQPSAATSDLKATLNGGSIRSTYTSVTYRQQITPGPATPFDAWCVEPLINDSPSPYNYEVSNVFGGSNFGGNAALQSAIERLWTAAESAAGAPTMSTDPSLPANWAQLAAAFQIALWELVSDGTAWNFDAGNVRLAATGVNAFTDGVRGLASTWLTTAFSTDTLGNFLTAQTSLEYLDTAVNSSGKGQDHIRRRGPGSGGDDPLPLPGAVWLLGLGALALSRFVRKV
jgi:hypothetical protein